MEYVGPPESHDTHGHSSHDPRKCLLIMALSDYEGIMLIRACLDGDSDGAHNYGGEPKTMADYVDASYR